MNNVKTILVLFLMFSYSIFSQSISIGLGGGVNFISGDNYYTDDLGRIGIYENINGTTTNLEGMGLTTEVQFQLAGKYSFDNSPFSLYALFNYYPLRGTEQMMIYDFIAMTELPKDVTTKMDVWSFQIGASYSIGFYAIKPFINASLTANYFDDLYVEISEPDYKTEFRSYENGMRYGYNIGIGFTYNIFSNTNLELSSNYNSFNVLHKRDGEELLNSINVLAIIYYQIM